MDQLHMLRAFVAAARHRSFSKAAVSLGVTTGSVSKAVAKLENSVQTRLLHRTTRSVNLTEAAQTYFLSCSKLLEELDEANRRITQEHEVDGGRLRLAIHPTLINETFARFIGQYRSVAPRVDLVISVHDGVVSLYDGQCDIAILPPNLVEQSVVIRRTLSQSRRIWVTTAGYLSRHDMPKTAADLAEHFLLLNPKIRRRDSDCIDLLEAGGLVSVRARSSLYGNEAMVHTAALAGAGIALLPELMIREDIARGHLVPVLPTCFTPDADAEICLFYSHRELLPARFRTFIDCCTEFFRAEASRTTVSTTPPACQAVRRMSALVTA
ncbi:LysR family transcriptional regulator [Nitrogeniibacter mangrovi]|uniref:LysR family transcriptional regulator n=1 Tax=Nitrogeniibacter mangrovi TaxID=2016596 RepID=A0A6C1B3D7_9RHOO|nr:LysR family transcriptional regulator [Nitrogeniibacter mangrovi]QID17358.1 LysR family transcriptional regulator [Nitrogeniibacter mangrovi]